MAVSSRNVEMNKANVYYRQPRHHLVLNDLAYWGKEDPRLFPSPKSHINPLSVSRGLIADKLAHAIPQL